jgi:natural product biosynthesis luciferase-like monooxygenase protein/thioester reductase-like protein
MSAPAGPPPSSPGSAAEQLEHLRRRLPARPPTASSRVRPPEDGRYPLSFPQRRLWFLEQVSPGSGAYQILSAARVSGPLRYPALRSVLGELVQRHAALRATFTTEGGEVFQRFAATLDLRLAEEDLTRGSAGGRDARTRHWLRAFAARPFSLQDGPLLRAALLRTGPDEHILAFCFHHLVVDGWSIGQIWRELLAGYDAAVTPAAASAAPPPGAAYADFVSWDAARSGERLDAERVYWRSRMEGAPPMLPLPADHLRPARPSYRGAAEPVLLPTEIAAGLRTLGREEGASLFMTLLALYAGLLHRYTGEADVVIGTPTANRRRPEFEHTVGLFTQTLAIRARPDGTRPFREFLRQVRDDVLDDFSHQDLPFERLVEELNPERDLSRHPVFQVMLGLHNMPDPAVPTGGLRVEFLDVETASSRYDLELALAERSGQLQGRLEYSTDLFDQATARRMAAHFSRLATSVIQDPDQPLGRLRLTTDNDLEWVLRQGRGPAGVPGTDLVHEAIGRQAAWTPDAVAVSCLGEELTFRDLDERASRLAHHLRDRGARPDRVVAVCLERSAELVVALLAVLKAGAAYLPLDPEFPGERVSYMLRDCAATIVVTSGWLARRLPSAGLDIVRVDDDAALIAARPAEPVPGGATAGSLAYVIYTSGSTGRPKGVMVEHANVRNLLYATDQLLPAAEKSPWLAVTSVSFDISVLELLWTLARGRQVVVRAGEDAGRVPASSGRDNLDLSLFYFGNDEHPDDGYRLLLDGARFADEHEFAAVWTPERHFHPFGGRFPNPALTSAAVAAVTGRLSIRAGSVVLPLHDPVRVAEQWSVVDNLSGGRVALSAASGWQPVDFALAPDDYQDRREVMRERIDQVRRLWRGEPLTRRSGTGELAEITSYPRPVQDDLPIWITAGGSRATFKLTGELGANLLTHLLGQNTDELRANVASYRAARAAAGHDPATGRVAVMLHTYVGDDLEEIRSLLREPFYRYLRSSFGLMSNLATALGRNDRAAAHLSDTDVEFLLAQAFDRYFESSGLIGTPESCARRAHELFELGVDELACLVDLGLDQDRVMAGLRRLAAVGDAARRRIRRSAEEGTGRLLAQHAIGGLQVTPSGLRAILDEEPGAATLSRLKTLLVGGEAFPPALASQLAGRGPARVINMYGPTETTVWSMASPVDPNAAAVPIGRPLANTQVLVLDDAGEPVPPGIVGEIHIGGTGVARGYLNRPALTAERFTPSRFGPPGSRLYRTGDRGYWADDGALRFAGRADEQVKVRGFRVEPREVETRLLEQDGVREAAVIASADRLAAYVVTGPGPGPDPEALRERLRTVLPDYMVPAAVIRLDRLPRTANGKLNRAGLAARQAPAPQARSRRAPRDDTERALAQIWGEVLDRPGIGVSDDFFAFGGHSLLAVRVITAIRDRLGLPIPLRCLFEAPTIARLARVIDTGAFATPRPASAQTLDQDAILPPEVRPARGGQWAPPSEVFLTGATGFVGRILLAELLSRTTVTVRCLVLAGGEETGLREIRDALTASELWRDEFSSRIVPVAGNLAQPQLGLPAQEYADLADTVDTVYHAAALVHLLYPYDVLKGPNVDGTAETLRLACLGRPKRFHYVSTLDVFADDAPHREDAPLESPCRAQGAYAQSKWAAEKLVAVARERGLATTVLRPGNVAGDTRTGYWNSHDQTYTLIRSCLALGTAPDLDMPVSLTPVDYVAAATTRLTLDERSVGRSFHLFNPHPPMPWLDLVEAVRAAGYPLDLMPYERWREQILTGEADPLSGMLRLTVESDSLAAAARGQSRLRRLEIDCSQAERALADSGIACDPVDEALITTYLARWRERGLIPAPGQHSSNTTAAAGESHDGS